MKTLKALAALIEYPGEDLLAAIGDIEQVLRTERLLRAGDVEALLPLLDYLAHGDLLDLQEAYVDTFDRGRATSLNLFEHVHGESRDRGQAMVDLKVQYENRGLLLSAHQLPDYLPAILEYLALGSPEEARAMLDDCAHILRSIGTALVRRESPYAPILQALLHLAGHEAHAESPSLADTEDDSTPEALDRAWAEEPVGFLGGACPTTPSATDVVHFHPKGTRP